MFLFIWVFFNRGSGQHNLNYGNSRERKCACQAHKNSSSLFILYILISWIFRQAVSKFRKDQKVCSQGLNLLIQLIPHLDDQANPGSSLQTSRDFAMHILNAFWWDKIPHLIFSYQVSWILDFWYSYRHVIHVVKKIEQQRL